MWLSRFFSRFKRKKKPKYRKKIFSYQSGLPALSERYQFKPALKLIQNDDGHRLELHVWGDPKSEPFYLRYEQICDISILSKADIKYKKRSVFGNVLVGNLFLGRTGAVLGYIHASEPKKVTNSYAFIHITYLPTRQFENVPEHPRTIVVRSGLFSLGFTRFFKKLAVKCNIAPKDKPKPQPKIGGYL